MIPAALRTRGTIVLLVAGANLSLINIVALTEFPALVGSNELVALIVLGAYFLGLSAGYLVSDRIGRAGLLWIGIPTLALHATLPFSAARYIGVAPSRFWALGLAPALSNWRPVSRSRMPPPTRASATRQIRAINARLSPLPVAASRSITAISP